MHAPDKNFATVSSTFVHAWRYNQRKMKVPQRRFTHNYKSCFVVVLHVCCYEDRLQQNMYIIVASNSNYKYDLSAANRKLKTWPSSSPWQHSKPGLSNTEKVRYYICFKWDTSVLMLQHYISNDSWCLCKIITQWDFWSSETCQPDRDSAHSTLNAHCSD